MRIRRRPPITLSAGEQRVLAAFYCGRLPAGRLSQALAVARSAPAQHVTAARAVRPQPQAVAEAAPLQLAA